jgi:PST family polysaccharide transporter
MVESLPLLISGMSIIVYMRSGPLFISQLLDQRSLGLYSTAQVLSELWYFLPMTIATSIAPAIARRRRASAEEYTAAVQRVFAFMWMLSIAVATVICLNASTIITLLYGKAYEDAAAVLAIYIYTLIPVSIGVIQSLWLVNENRGRITIYQALGGAAASLSLNYLLIPSFGIVGSLRTCSGCRSVRCSTASPPLQANWLR